MNTPSFIPTISPPERRGGAQFSLPLWAPPLAVLLLLGCKPPTPPQPPEPPQPGPKYVEMLLRADGPSGFKTIEGEPVEFRGAISCCMDNDWGGSSGWPFNIHPDWQEYASRTFGANFFHARVGPFLGSVEPEWAEVGGPYATAPDGRADLSRWNDAFWDTARAYIEHAAERGRYVEVDIIDGWYCKRGQWGDVATPWAGAHNIQGQQWVGRCGSEPIQPGTEFDRWVAKVVAEFGPYGNVIWEDGNEIGQTPGYTPEWSLSLRDLVRRYEYELAFGVVHLFGTNSHSDIVQAQVDYVEHHSTQPLSAPLAGRLSLVNEYNPNPPFSPTAMNDKRCFAGESGTFWWYWRHSQSLEQMGQTGVLYRQPCGTAPPTDCLPVPETCGAKFVLASHWSGAIDSTYTVTSCCDYCKAIGMGEYNGQPRCGCPILPEGHPDREKCERAAIGKQRWFCNGVELGLCGDAPCVTSNPAQAYCSGTVKTCTEDLRFCSEGEF